MPQVVFHGSERERSDLLDCLERNCQCAFAPSGARTVRCPGHTALVEDQRWIDRLCFLRTLRAQLTLEEYLS